MPISGSWAERNFEAARRLWHLPAQNQHVDVRENVRNHPENRADQNQKFNHFGRTVRDIREQKHGDRNQNDTDIRTAALVGLSENLRQHVHLCHAFADVRQTVDAGVLCADNGKRRDKGHPDFSGVAEQCFAVQHVRCQRNS